MQRTWIAGGSAVLLMAVAFGAFGAHALKDVLSPTALGQWRTGVEYQFYHGLGLLLLAGFGNGLGPSSVRWAGRLMGVGIVLFSGSLYLLSIRDMTGIQGLAGVLGPITPIGGLCFMAAWATLFITALRQGDGRYSGR